MGYRTEFNWALKLKKEQGLDEDNLKAGDEYDFSKKGARTYPINIPIDLINSSWEAIGKVVVVETNIKEDLTKGKYKVLKLFDDKEKEFLTNYWRENIEYIKKEKITDFSDVKVS